MAASGKQNAIDLNQLPLDQLNQLKQSLQEEVEQFTGHYATLKDAASRLHSCKGTILDMSVTSSGSEILVPLTQSLYVPGKTLEAEKLLVDIGTGYFVEKSVEKSKEYLDRKLSVVNKNAESVQNLLSQKEQNLRLVSAFMQRKIMMMSTQTKGTGSTAG